MIAHVMMTVPPEQGILQFLQKLEEKTTVTIKEVIYPGTLTDEVDYIICQLEGSFTVLGLAIEWSRIHGAIVDILSDMGNPA